MNGRVEENKTPEGRLAAVVISILKKKKEDEWWKLDYADFAAALAPFVQREIINARLDELRNRRSAVLEANIKRERELFQELAKVEGTIAGIT